MGQKLTTAQPTHGRQVLRAAKRGDTEALSSMIRVSPLLASYMDHNGNTAVHHAAREGHLVTLEALVDIIKQQATALLEAQQQAGEEVTEGAEPPSSAEAATPQRLLEQLLNGRTHKGLTPLMLACKEGHEAVVTLLLKHGANPLILERGKLRSCLHFAAAKGHAGCVQALFNSPVTLPGRSGSLADVLMPEGSPARGYFRYIDLKIASGFSALHVASFFGHLAVVRALLQAGAQLGCRTSNQDGQGEINCCPASTPLHLATMMGNGNAVLMLLEAQVTSLEQLLPSALYSPQRRLDWEGHSQRDIRLLYDSQGDTPHSLALTLGYKRIAALLEPRTPILALLRLRPPTLGMPSLQVLAQTALHQHLLSWLDSYVFEFEQNSQDARETTNTPWPAEGCLEEEAPGLLGPAAGSSCNDGAPERERGAEGGGCHVGLARTVSEASLVAAEDAPEGDSGPLPAECMADDTGPATASADGGRTRSAVAGISGGAVLAGQGPRLLHQLNEIGDQEEEEEGEEEAGEAGSLSGSAASAAAALLPLPVGGWLPYIRSLLGVEEELAEGPPSNCPGLGAEASSSEGATAIAAATGEGKLEILAAVIAAQGGSGCCHLGLSASRRGCMETADVEEPNGYGQASAAAPTAVALPLLEASVAESIVNAGIRASADAAAETKVEEEEDAALCGVCLDAVATVGLAPCRHELCVVCCRRLVEACKKPTECPFCRRKIAGFKHSKTA